MYSGHFPRFRETDFNLFSKNKVGSDWPFNYSDLEKYYNLNDRIMNVSGRIGDPKYPPIKNLNKEIKLDKYGSEIFNGFKKLGWHCWPSYSSLIKKKFEFNRLSVNESYLPLAINKGVKIKKNCRVKKLILNKKGLIDGIVYTNSKGKETFFKSKLVILACNAVGTTRILLNSANNKFPQGLANSSGLVGKNLMLHPLAFVQGVSKKFLGSHIGSQGCCLFSHEFSETRKKKKFKKGYMMQILRSGGPVETAHYLKKLNLLRFGKTFHDDFFKFYGKSIQVAIVCEDFPEKHNRVTLDKKNKDSSGMPGVKIHYKLSDNSKKMMADGIQNAKKLLKTINAKTTFAFGPIKYAGWHLMGTAKMGKNKKNSVTNENGQTHDIKNLFIVDGSLFPSSSCVNIMSTVQALSLKITDKIKESPQKYLDINEK